MCDLLVRVTRDREFNLTLNVQWDCACHTTICAKKKRQDCIVLIWSKLQVPQQHSQFRHFFWRVLAKRTASFPVPFVSGPSHSHKLGHQWDVESCQAVWVGSLQREGIHVLGGQDPRRILVRR